MWLRKEKYLNKGTISTKVSFKIHQCTQIRVVWGVWGIQFEPRHNKTNKMSVRPAKTQNNLGIRTVWSESSLSTWRRLGSLATHWAHSEDSDQTGRMPRLIWVLAGRTITLLVLSCRGSFNDYCRFVAYYKLNPPTDKLLLQHGIRQYHNDPKFLERQVLANSADPDQIAPTLGLHCLALHLRLLDALLSGKTALFQL